MPQIHTNKKQQRQEFQPVFTNASSFLSQKAPEDSTSTLPVDSISLQQESSEIYKKLNFYRQKAMVPNTEKSTRNWIAKFEEFRKNYNYVIPLDKITDSELIEQQVCEYIAQMSKKKNAGEYKANTVKQAVDAINRHLVKFSPIHGINLHDKYKFLDLWTVLHGKMKDLQEKGFGEKEGSMALTAQQVQEILADNFLNTNTLKAFYIEYFFEMQLILHVMVENTTTFVLINFNLYLMVVYFFGIIVAKTTNVELKEVFHKIFTFLQIQKQLMISINIFQNVLMVLLKNFIYKLINFGVKLEFGIKKNIVVSIE